MILTSCSQRSSGNSSTGETYCSPALFTRTSTPPHSAIARSTSARQSARELTSALMNTLPGIPFAAVSPSSALRSARRTCAPCIARSTATARPIPLAAPVTSALLPTRSATAFTRAVRYGASRVRRRNAGTAQGLRGLPRRGRRGSAPRRRSGARAGRTERRGEDEPLQPPDGLPFADERTDPHLRERRDRAAARSDRDARRRTLVPDHEPLRGAERGRACRPRAAVAHRTGARLLAG